jgi:hypothetical protein
MQFIDSSLSSTDIPDKYGTIKTPCNRNAGIKTTSWTSTSSVINRHGKKIRFPILASRVVDPDPKPDPHGSGTFCRIRNRIQNFRLWIRIRLWIRD